MLVFAVAKALPREDRPAGSERTLTHAEVAEVLPAQSDHGAALSSL